MKEQKNKKAVSYAVMAAALYAVSAPVSKLLLKEVPPAMMAALLYWGAGIGLTILTVIGPRGQKTLKAESFTRADIVDTVAMVLLDIAAPILLLAGLTMTTAANVSLLNNFEIVATSIIAFFIFKEPMTKRLWMGIGLVTLASFILSFEDMSSFSFSYGSIFVLLACVCWGIENNCTRRLSSKNPIHIVIIKGFGSGTGSFLIALSLGKTITNLHYILIALLLGFVAYGLSIVCYIYAQRYLGASKTSAYYALTPFIGTALSIVILKEKLTLLFISALIVMAVGTYFVSKND